jgi:hypothetical protein
VTNTVQLANTIQYDAAPSPAPITLDDVQVGQTVRMEYNGLVLGKITPLLILGKVGVNTSLDGEIVTFVIAGKEKDTKISEPIRADETVAEVVLRWINTNPTLITSVRNAADRLDKPDAETLTEYLGAPSSDEDRVMEMSDEEALEMLLCIAENMH